MTAVVSAILMSIAALSQMPFTEACDGWLESRKHHLAPRTYQDYSEYIKILSRYFVGVRLPDIDGDMVRRYQHDRREKASPSTINKELGIIKQLRERIGKPLTDYQRLQTPKDYETPGRALNPSEEVALERACKTFANHETWDVGALCLLLAMRTGMTRSEILSLKLKDIEIGANPSILTIPRRGAKRVARERTVALLGDAEWAVVKLIERCRTKCGGFAPDHFLVPFRAHKQAWDPCRPAKHYREGAWHILAVAGIECRINDMRHHAMSKALRNPRVSLAMAREQFGHVDNKMQRRYYHGNLENLIAVARALDEKKPVQNTADSVRRPKVSAFVGSR
jgi:integrase